MSSQFYSAKQQEKNLHVKLVVFKCHSHNTTVTVTSIYASNRLTLVLYTIDTVQRRLQKSNRNSTMSSRFKTNYSLKVHDAHLIKVSIANFGISHEGSTAKITSSQNENHGYQ